MSVRVNVRMSKVIRTRPTPIVEPCFLIKLLSRPVTLVAMTVRLTLNWMFLRWHSFFKWKTKIASKPSFYFSWWPSFEITLYCSYLKSALFTSLTPLPISKIVLMQSIYFWNLLLKHVLHPNKFSHYCNYCAVINDNDFLCVLFFKILMVCWTFTGLELWKPCRE